MSAFDDKNVVGVFSLSPWQGKEGELLSSPSESSPFDDVDELLSSTTTSAMNNGHNFLFRPKEWNLALVYVDTRRLSVLFLNIHNMYIYLDSWFVM